MLVVIGGLPGVGKTTIAHALALDLGATFLRADTIEQAIREAGQEDIGPMGYMVAYRVAAENLKLGRTVIADLVNPLQITRQAWRDVASEAGTDVMEVEVFCSDEAEHRRRVESRTSDIQNFRLPTWAEVLSREFEPWDLPPFRLDTSSLSTREAVEQIKLRLAQHRKLVSP